MALFLNRVRCQTATTGSGTLTIGAALAGFCTPVEAGAVDGATYTYCLTEGADFELGRGVYTSAGTALTRATVLLSKIGGVAGTAKMNLAGSAVVFVTEAAEDIADNLAWANLTGIPAAIDAIDGLTPAADRYAYYTGASSAALGTLTAFARTLLDDADAAAALGTLGITNAVLKHGDIKITLDETAPSGFAELNGATLVGGATTYPNVAARYPWMVSGSDLILPDARGKFMRVWAHGSANDPDRLTRTARVGGTAGDFPGTGQADAIRNITGMLSLGNGMRYGNSDGAFTISDFTSSGAGVGGNDGYRDATFSAANVVATGGDNRPINVNVCAWMLMG